MEMEILYVVVCRDRHRDDAITVHRTREGADRQIEEFKVGYEDLEWSEQNYGRDIGWVRYVDSDEDGPSAIIQKVELKP